MYVCMYEVPLNSSRALYMQWVGQPFGPHLPNAVIINQSRHVTNTQALILDLFYSRPMEAAEATIWVDLAPAWVNPG